MRYALLFEPGSHDLDVKVGFYTSVHGLGKTPSETLMSGVVSWDGSKNMNPGALQNFWRSAENFKIANQWNTMTWAVS